MDKPCAAAGTAVAGTDVIITATTRVIRRLVGFLSFSGEAASHEDEILLKKMDITIKYVMKRCISR